jgi:phage shock protein A
MTNPRSTYSLLGVLAGFACVFPLLVKREKKPLSSSADALLEQAQQQMREAQAKNRGRAVQAITQKNNLQALVDQTQKRIDKLTERAESADFTVERETQRSLLAERDKLQASLAEMQAGLATAIGAAEAVKAAMRREEEFVRLKVTEALTLKATEKQAQIETAIAKSRMALTTNLATDLFVQAREKIKQTAAQRDVIVQIGKTVEVLDAAVEEAANAGNEPMRQRLAANRDALRASALNASLWKG